VVSNGSLFLHPVDAGASCPRDLLVDTLRRLGMIDAAWAGAGNAYLVGHGFLQLITFMGCSPRVELEPPAGGDTDFCHIVVHALDGPRLLAGTNTRPPRCPACRKVIAIDVASLLRDRPGRPVVCNHCHARHSLDGLGWRRDAGFGRLFVEIRSVFPGEAVPVDRLVNALAGTTGCHWDYFYLTFRSGRQFEPLRQPDVDGDREMVGKGIVEHL
jgi:hypothetical protein